MGKAHICPWWLCFTFDNPLRRLLQNPQAIIRPYVHPGDRILDIGPGMGYFTIPMAKMVGETGKVIAADIQPPMLEHLMRRAQKKHVHRRVEPIVVNGEDLCFSGVADFVLAFWMVHEAPDQLKLLRQIRAALKRNGRFLLAEPIIHVRKQAFHTSVELAEKAGLEPIALPRIFLSRAVVFRIR